MRRNQYNDIIRAGSEVVNLQTSLAQTNSLAKIAKGIQAAQIGLYQSNDFRNAVTTLTQLQTRINQSSGLRNAAEVITRLQTGFYQSNEFRNAVATFIQLQTRIDQSEDLKRLARFSMDATASLQAIHVEFSKSFVALLQAMSAKPTEFGALPPVVATLPSIEIYNSSRVLEALSEQDTDPELQGQYHYIEETEAEIENSLEFLLRELDPELIRMWRGINDALSSESEDRIRHFSASSRELFTHIVHKLAPDDELREWTDDPNHFHENRPTRKARVLYICRSFDHSQFSNFVDKDINASIALSDLFQSGVHAIETDLTSGQMSALKIRIEGALRFLLETARVMKT